MTAPDTVAPIARGVRQYTDLGNAERLVTQHGTDLRYCHPLGAWFVWDGRRWNTDNTGEVMRRAKDTVRAMYGEAALLDQSDERQALVKHAQRSEEARRLRAMIDLATSEPGIPVTVDELDTDPHLFAAANGTVDLRTGKLRDHDRADLITKLSPVEYDPEAGCARWLSFLEGIGLTGDLGAYVRRLAGYSLTGLSTEQILAILYGTGANGKTTLLEGVRHVAGDYGAQTATDTLMDRAQGTIPNDLARLRGARFVSAVETDEGRRLAEGTVKRITGGDAIAARFLNREWFEYRPAFTVWLAANHKPTVRGTDEAIWRRIHLVPFTTTIPEADRDHDLPDKLRAEAPGILAWAVGGAVEWYRDGLNPPAEVRQATSSYRGEMDTLGDFLTECTTEDEADYVTKADLFAAYVKWCEDSGERPLSQRQLARRLSERGLDDYQQPTGDRARCWLGVRLTTEAKP